MTGSSFGEMMSTCIGPLLDAAGIGAGTEVLDVACGASVRAGSAAAARGAKVTGMDASQPEIATARREFPEFRFEVGDAENLPFADESFDAVVMSYGLLHFSGALSEAWRVLRPGSRIAFSTWASPEKVAGYGAAIDALEALEDSSHPPATSRSYFRFADHGTCHQVLSKAGFVRSTVSEVSQVWSPGSEAAAFDYLYGGIIVGRELREKGPAARDALCRSVMKDLAALREGRQLEIPMPVVLASGKKP